MLLSKAFGGDNDDGNEPSSKIKCDGLADIYDTKKQRNLSFNGYRGTKTNDRTRSRIQY